MFPVRTYLVKTDYKTRIDLFVLCTLKGVDSSKKRRVTDSDLINSERKAQREAIQQRLANKLKSLGGNETKPTLVPSPAEAVPNDEQIEETVPTLDKCSDVAPAAVEKPATVAPAAVAEPAIVAPAAVEKPATVAPAAVAEPAIVAPAAVAEPAIVAPVEKHVAELPPAKV